MPSRRTRSSARDRARSGATKPDSELTSKSTVSTRDQRASRPEHRLGARDAGRVSLEERVRLGPPRARGSDRARVERSRCADRRPRLVSRRDAHHDAGERDYVACRSACSTLLHFEPAGRCQVGAAERAGRKADADDTRCRAGPTIKSCRRTSTSSIGRAVGERREPSQQRVGLIERERDDRSASPLLVATS